MRTNQKSQSIAKAKAKNDKIEVPMRPAKFKGRSNFDLMKSQSYEDFCGCLEYIFLLRVVHGQGGFMRTIKYFPDSLDPAWEELEKDGLISMFRGRRKGFVMRWLTELMYSKLMAQDIIVFSRWLTYFDRFEPYRREILNGKHHNLIFGDMVDEDILSWLEADA